MNTKITILLLITISMVHGAIRCWSGMETISNGKRLPSESGTPFQSVLCDAEYCFNSYVKRKVKGDDSYTISKSCGEIGKCFEVGCEGPLVEKKCCCASDLCNSSNGLNVGLAGILIIIASLIF